MKKPYQIESQRAVKRLEEMVADGNPAVQMVLPMAEMVGWLREGVGELIRRAGLQMVELLMEEEVRQAPSAFDDLAKSEDTISAFARDVHQTTARLQELEAQLEGVTLTEADVLRETG